MRRLRVLLLALAVLAGLLAVAIAATWGMARLGWFQREATQRLSVALDWPVSTEGLAVGAFPLPWIEAEELVFAAAAEGEPPLARAARVRVELPWRTLLGRGQHLARIELQAPQLNLAVDAAGQGNWEPLLERLVALGGEGPAAWSIGVLQMERGGLELQQGPDATRLTLTGISLEASSLRPGAAFPFETRLAGHADDLTFHVTGSGNAILDLDNGRYAAEEAALQGWIGGGSLPLAGVDWDATLLRAEVDPAAGTARLQDLRLDSRGRQLALNLQARWDEAGLALDTFDGQLDDSRFSGSAALPDSGRPQLRLEVDQLDLDRYLPSATAEDEEPASPQQALAQALDPVLALDVDATLHFGELRGSGVVARDLKVVLAPVAEEQAP